MLGKAIRWVVLVLVVAALVAGGRFLVQRKRQALAKSPKFELRATPVDTAAATTGNLDEGHDYLSVIEPLQIANVSARITATVEKVHRQEGETVQAGDVLVTLDDRQFRDGVATMEAQTQQAKADLAANQASVTSLKESLAYWQRESERDRKLAVGGTIPPAQAEATAERTNEARGKLTSAEQKSRALEQQVEALQRKTDELRTTLTYCTIASPFAGVVTVKAVDAGDLASPGKTLLVVEDRSTLKLAFDVPQGDLPAFAAGLPVSFTVGDKVRQAAVSRLYPALNRARMVRAEALLTGPATEGLTLGAYVNAAVVFRRRENVTLVPVTAIVESPEGTPRVFVVRDGRLQVRPVTLLGTACELAGVEGVAAGEQVVISSFLGWARLSDSMAVEARQ
ncbi:MAG: hypothetical protein A3K19_29340 [Lentisphaerae bacterium RIFOXYB12_FULL_65_16]|nr:MAG: hypothetical protein A3K18_13305 [Lentisphaerae bacterium RIFOXYA12_64_32]OGV88403.1 MAG: hypothetical protein A3K19_29340 [Lentisphaerae bacterium RIFOXYB12_FULL_65_16]